MPAQVAVCRFGRDPGQADGDGRFRSLLTTAVGRKQTFTNVRYRPIADAIAGRQNVLKLTQLFYASSTDPHAVAKCDERW